MLRIEIEMVEGENKHVGIVSQVVSGTGDKLPTEIEARTSEVVSKAIYEALHDCKDFATVEDLKLKGA